MHKAVAAGNLTETEKILQSIEGFTKQRKKLLLNSVSNGTTPLGKAIEQGAEPIVKLLIQQPQIDINKTGRDELSLLLALKHKKPNIAHILLTQSGKNKLNIRDSLPGIDVNQQDEYGNSFLHIAVTYNDPKIINCFLKVEHINPNIQNNNGNTPLHMAVQSDNIDVIDTLLLGANKINANIQNNDGNTPLHMAAELGEMEVVKHLLRVKNINVNIKNSGNMTAWDVANGWGHQNIARLLQETIAKSNTKPMQNSIPPNQ